LEAVKTAFRRLVNLVPQRGVILAHDAQKNLDEVLAKAFCPVERYGLSDRVQWQIANLEYSPESTQWCVLREGKPWADLQFSLAGEYNVLNATAASAMATHFGIQLDAIQEALRTFKSVKRRLEVKAEVGGVTIIDDFAHHPTAIAETLKALRSRYAGRRLWAVCEPRSNTLRRRVFEKELAQSLAIADEVVIASIFKPEAIREDERLRVHAVVEGAKKLGRPARELADADAIVSSISPELREGDVVAILSNGGFGGIYDKLPKTIADRT
jgi:UDP-N-acetylmuramate: L-alanyl-gamma-D-glutamyl-meso-diaminopimelate ligase